VSLRGKRTESNPWQPLATAEMTPLADPGEQLPPSMQPVAVTPNDVAAARVAIAERWQKIQAPTYATRAAKPALPATARSDGDGMRWGSVIHLLLQAAMREPSGDLNAIAVSALRASELDAALAAEAVTVVRRVMKSALWRRAAGKCLTEVPLVVAMPDGLVRGVIDLAFAEAGGWVLVDYKTDRDEGLLEKYRPQLESYRACWQAATGQPVKELGLYAVATDRYLVLEP
jgi:ATP-dependent helicase/nuclease subunit A